MGIGINEPAFTKAQLAYAAAATTRETATLYIPYRVAKKELKAV